MSRTLISTYHNGNGYIQFLWLQRLLTTCLLEALTIYGFWRPSLLLSNHLRLEGYCWLSEQILMFTAIKGDCVISYNKLKKIGFLCLQLMIMNQQTLIRTSSKNRKISMHTLALANRFDASGVQFKHNKSKTEGQVNLQTGFNWQTCLKY